MQDNATQYAVNAYTFFQVKLFGSSWGGRLWYDLRQITRWDWVIWVVELLSCRPICSQSCIVMGCWDLSISFNISQLFFNIFLIFWARFFAKWTVQLSLKAQGMVVTSSHNHSHTQNFRFSNDVRFLEILFGQSWLISISAPEGYQYPFKSE
jgi:hypothetical protein